MPMFVAFVVLTATAAVRLTGRYWTGPVAVAVALFGTVASPYGWVGTPVFNTQTLGVTWISPTNLFGLALFSAVVLALIDLLQPEARHPRRYWLLIVLMIFGCAGAKASLLPLLIVGLVFVVAGVAVTRRRLHRNATTGLGLVGCFSRRNCCTADRRAGPTSDWTRCAPSQLWVSPAPRVRPALRASSCPSQPSLSPQSSGRSCGRERTGWWAETVDRVSMLRRSC
jgi:hypothetical protein